MLTQQMLKDMFYYSPNFGIFVWKKTIATRAKIGTIAGHIGSQGYVRIRINGKAYSAHRMAFLYMEGMLPLRAVDHINGARADNSWANLRHATYLENSKNKKLQKNSSSGIIGVNFTSSSNKWTSRIGSNKERIELGVFPDFFEACCARKSAEIRYEFHKNHGRKK